MLRALRHRNYRLFFGGQGTSLIGTWITRIATSWLVYRLTGSELLLGLNGFCGQIPMLILGPFAGVICDRFNKHRILLITQTLSLLQSALLAFLAFRGIITVPWILGLQLCQGVINSFDMPARQAFVPRMIDDPKDLSNAIALNSSLVNSSRILGPTVGGILLASVGEAWCFAVDAVSYVFVIVSLLLMHVPRAARPRSKSIGSELTEGIRYVWSFVPVRTLLLQLGVLGVVSMPYTVLMPVVATSVLHGGPSTLGALMTAQGVGALIGAIYLANRESILGLTRIMVAATAAFGVGLVGFALSPWITLSMFVLLIANGGFMMLMASTNTILQTIVDEDMRGRVMSFYAMAMLGTAPIGSLIGGALAEQIGAPATIILGGIAAVATGLWFSLKRQQLRCLIRPIYIARGILPAPEMAVHAATPAA